MLLQIMKRIDGVIETGGSSLTPLMPGYTLLTGTGTFTPAASTKYLYVVCQGAGGGGGGGNNDSSGYGGGGGGCWMGYFNYEQSFSYSVGTGGAAGVSNSSSSLTTAGSTGGNTWFKSTATQGNGGSGGASTVVETNNPAAGGNGAGGTFGYIVPGSRGGCPYENGTNKYSGEGGTSYLSGHRGSRYNTLAENSFLFYGNGGSGGTATLTRNPQPGYDGVILVWEFKYE